jgi:GR25 family glycosyltransferase involved in LPS biosynthesis
MDTFFDKIYVIHLDKDIERKQSIEVQFQKHNITNYLFFPAVTKLNIDKEKFKEDKLWAYPNNTFHCQRTCSCGGKGHELSEAQMACHLSHHNVWLDIVQNNYENCLVIEDDLVLINDVNEVFTAMMEHWPKIWDFTPVSLWIETKIFILKLKIFLLFNPKKHTVLDFMSFCCVKVVVWHGIYKIPWFAMNEHR